MGIWGKIIVIVAPSGTGKSTLIKKAMENFPELHWSVSFTTRQARQGEVSGKHYFFISPEEFSQKQKRGDFVEWAQVHGHYYGTSKEFVQSQMEKGQSLLFDLDIQGVDQMKKIFKDSKAIYIAPPNVSELEKRLRGRQTESEEVIQLRLENAKKELERKDDFDYLVINDNLEHAISQLKVHIKEILKG